MASGAGPKAKAYLDDVPSYAVSETVDDIAARYGLERIVYLASNENPYGCSPEVAAAMAAASDSSHRYPDGSGLQLKQKIAEAVGVASGQVMLGNGSNEILDSVAKAFLGQGDELIVSDHSFAMYPIFAKCVGASVVSVPMTDWNVDLEAIQQVVSEKTRVIFIANANNPTGTMLTTKAIEEFLNAIPSDVLVVVDEAYIEFAESHYGQATSLLSQFENLLVCRTFSKAYGLAGFRIGYGVSSAGIIQTLEKICQPFNINLFALSAAQAAIADQDYLNSVTQKNAFQRRIFEEFFTQQGIHFLPSQANFIAIELPDQAQQCYEFLLQQGVIVRRLSSYKMNDWLRISIGTADENQWCMDTLSLFLEQHIER